MDRVSSQMTPYDMQYYMRRNGVRSNELSNKVAGNTRVLDPRDNPSAAANAVLLSSKIDRLQTFVENAERMKEDIRLAENSLQQANAILHDVRELAVAASNGTYSEYDRKIMANQLNEYLYGLLDLANARDEDGIALFSGTRRSQDAFKALEGSVEGSGRPVIVSVEYIGDNGGRATEIADGRFAEFSNAGDHLFWANYTICFGQTTTEFTRRLTLSATGFCRIRRFSSTERKSRFRPETTFTPSSIKSTRPICVSALRLTKSEGRLFWKRPNRIKFGWKMSATVPFFPIWDLLKPTSCLRTIWPAESSVPADRFSMRLSGSAINSTAIMRLTPAERD